MAQSGDKDDFNLDDFQFSGVGLTSKGNLSQDLPAMEPLPIEEAQPLSASGEIAAPVEPEEKKAKKKAKKEKKAKEKKVPHPEDANAEVREKNAFLERLAQANPFTVLLAIALLALIVSVLILFIELYSRYHLDIRAKNLAMNGSASAPFSVRAADIDNDSGGRFFFA